MAYKFKTALAADTFYRKYAHNGEADSWPLLAQRVVDRVCGPQGTNPALMSKDDRKELVKYITDMKFIPGGRYLYYSSKQASFFNNCFCLKAEEDTREEWAALTARAMSCLMTGGGIGVDYSLLRASGLPLSRTGGTSSGPIPLMKTINEVGRNVMQGGSRRSANWAGLNWQHEDIDEFLYIKDDMNNNNFDMTNISILWDDDFLFAAQNGSIPDMWYDSVKQMCRTGEPGHCYNFGAKSNETLRNA